MSSVIDKGDGDEEKRRGKELGWSWWSAVLYSV